VILVNIGSYFADYKYGLQIRKIPVRAIYLIAMILRNALFNTMNGSNTSIYYKNWFNQGKTIKII
jgi:hypothetical protein